MSTSLSPSAVGAFAFDIRIGALGPVSMTLGFHFPPHERLVVFRNHSCVKSPSAVRAEQMPFRFARDPAEISWGAGWAAARRLRPCHDWSSAPSR